MSNSPIIGPGEPVQTLERVHVTPAAGGADFIADLNAGPMIQLLDEGDYHFIWAQDQSVYRWVGDKGVDIGSGGGYTVLASDVVLIAYAKEGGVKFLRDLEDTAVDAPPAINDLLTWDGANWVNVPRSSLPFIDDHTQLQNIGTNSHADLDAHLASGAIHFPDAASDGKIYGRQNGAWQEVQGIETVVFVSDSTSDLEATVHEAWNDYGNRNNISRTSNQILYFVWPSTNGDAYQYLGPQLAPVWSSGPTDWVTVGGGAVSWGQITGQIAMQTDLANALDAKGAVGIDLTFDPTTTMEDPGNGTLRLDTADQSLATNIAVSAFSSLGNSLVKHWNGHQKGDLYNLVEKGDQYEYITFELTGDPVNNTTWFQIPVKVLDFRGPMHTGAVGLYYTNDPRSTVRVGGTAGQVLAKKDGNDFQMEWVDPDTGPQGPQGEAATIAVGTTTTLAPGSDATVTNSGDANDAVFDFGIPEGVKGDTGAAGTPGTDGNTILSGAVDPTTEGVDGDFYLNTATNTLFGPKAAGAWPTPGVSLIGPQGPAGGDGADGADGIDGATILAFTAGAGIPPADTLGVDGDWAINTAVAELWGPKAAGTWVGTGPVALTGPQGPQGIQGEQGLQGAKGDTGDTGPAGAAATADAGTTTTLAPGAPATVTNVGTTSAAVFDFGIPQGAKGDTGDTGPQGPSGEGITLIGDRTVAEMNADDGSTNAPGDTWSMLDAGQITSGTQPVTVAIDDLVGWAEEGHWINFGAIQGPQGEKGDTGDTGPAGADGADGADGKTVLNGTVPPTTEGVDGDFYIDTATDTIYGPKAAGAWPTPGTPLVGPQGPAGADGTDGAAGADGKTVLNGVVPPVGGDGTDGDFWIDTAADIIYGPKAGGVWPTPGTSLVGPQGATGPQGDQGIPGNDGADGAQGPKGDTGDTGPAGADGADGKTVLNGVVPPVAGDGTDGDFWIDTATDTIYGPKAAGAWPTPGTSLVGPQGPAGADGTDGATGPAGPTAVSADTPNMAELGTDSLLFVQDAPSDGTTFARRDGAWIRNPEWVLEAPNDGVAYNRQSKAWVPAAGIEIVNHVSDATSDPLATVEEAWNDFATRTNVTKESNELFFFRWPSASQDTYQYIGSQSAPPWTSTSTDWVSLGGGATNWGDIIGNMDDQTDLSRGLDQKGAVGLDYTFISGTDATDPGAGNAKVNNADQSLVTAIYVSATTGVGNDLSGWWNGFQEFDFLNFIEKGRERNFSSFMINGPIVDNGTWFTVPVESLDYQGDVNASTACQFYWMINPYYGVRNGGLAGEVYTKTADGAGNEGWAPIPPTDWADIPNKPATFPPAAHALDSHSDVNAPTPDDGERLAWNAVTGMWEPRRSTSALGIVAFDYRWSTAPNSAPTGGQVSADNVDPTLVTNVYINELDFGGNDISIYLENMGEGDWLNIIDRDDDTRTNQYDVAGVPVLAAGVYTVPVVYYANNGAAFSNNEQVALFIRYTSAGVTDHTDLTSIGVNTHDQIDTHIAATGNPHGTTVANLGDTTLTSPAADEVLTFDGSAWVNSAPSTFQPVEDNVTITVGASGQFQWLEDAFEWVQNNSVANSAVDANARFKRPRITIQLEAGTYPCANPNGKNKGILALEDIGAQIQILGVGDGYFTAAMTTIGEDRFDQIIFSGCHSVHIDDVDFLAKVKFQNSFGQIAGTNNYSVSFRTELSVERGSSVTFAGDVHAADVLTNEHGNIDWFSGAFYSDDFFDHPLRVGVPGVDPYVSPTISAYFGGSISHNDIRLNSGLSWTTSLRPKVISAAEGGRVYVNYWEVISAVDPFEAIGDIGTANGKMSGLLAIMQDDSAAPLPAGTAPNVINQYTKGGGGLFAQFDATPGSVEGMTSEAPAWEDITGKPTEFPPSAHTHVKADITDFAHTHDAADLPATMPPSAHSHAAGELPANVVYGTPDGTKIEIVAALPGTPDASTIYFVTG